MKTLYARFKRKAMTGQCFLIIDAQNDYLDPWDRHKVTRLVSRINEVVAAFRECGLPIVWIKTEFRADLTDAFLEMRDRNISMVIEGGRGADFHSELDWQPCDKTIIKKRYSAFFRSELDTYLVERGIEKLAICGINTHACIRMSAIDAYQRDLRVLLIEDAVDSYDDEHSRVSMNYMDGKIAVVASSQDVVRSLATRVVGVDSAEWRR